MKFSGEIRIPELDHPGIPATVLVEDGLLEVILEGESLGRWSLYDVQARRLISAAFTLELGEDELTFIADEPIDFAYRGVEKMAETWAKYKTMRLPMRTMAVRGSRRNATPSRIPELREAMEANLATQRAPSILSPRPVSPPEIEEPPAAALDVAEPSIDNSALDAERLAILEEKRRLEEERAQFEAVRAEADRQDAERIEAFRLEMERLEEERAAAHRIETERADAYRLEMERMQAERASLEGLVEQHRLREEDQATRDQVLRAELERLESERAEMERLEEERISAAEAAMALVAARQAELHRVEAERLERERQEAERLEAERAELERLEAARLDAARLEAARLEAERAEAERLEAARLEAARLEAERLEAESRKTSEESIVTAASNGDGSKHGRRKGKDERHRAEEATPPPPQPTQAEEAKEVVVDLVAYESPLPEPALAGAVREKAGLRGAVRSAFARNRNHDHVFVPAPGGIGISRSICNECGYVSISSSD